jgi:hypothetical protein
MSLDLFYGVLLTKSYKACFKGNMTWRLSFTIHRTARRDFVFLRLGTTVDRSSIKIYFSSFFWLRALTLPPRINKEATSALWLTSNGAPLDCKLEPKAGWQGVRVRVSIFHLCFTCFIKFIYLALVLTFFIKNHMLKVYSGLDVA